MDILKEYHLYSKIKVIGTHCDDKYNHPEDKERFC